MREIPPNALIAAIVLPLFYLALYADYAWSQAQGRADYERNDTVASVSVSVLMYALGTVLIVVRTAIYSFAWSQLALVEWPLASPVSWILGLLLYDFTYYWQHRMGHEWNLLWASHVVHHSSERFNLATALRVPTASMHLWTWVFALPLAIAGFPPAVFAVAALLNLLYQFWIHTERIGKLGWFDRWFGSPSNHRVHHGVNDRYLDKNYGGILMCWDRLFGTFEEERADDPVVYGTRAPVQSWNPLWINLHTPLALLRDARRARRWRDKFAIWFRGPGWRPADVAAADPKPPFVLAEQRLFEGSAPASLAHYGLLQSALLVPALIHMIVIASWLPFWPELGYAAYLSVGSIALGMLLSASPAQRSAGLWLELMRSALTLALAGAGVWFGELVLPLAGRIVLAVVALASGAWLLRIWRRHRLL